MFHRKTIERFIDGHNKNYESIKKIEKEIEYLKLQIESIQKVEKSHWNYIQALMDAEKQNRKDLNTIISKINQMKTKGKK